jgi:hypothetical protein
MIFSAKQCLITVSLAASFVIGIGTGAIAESFNTKNFSVKITRNCPEGYVTCDNVTYQGRELRSGKSIRLKGRTQHTICKDGVTPCMFLGYTFRNGNYLYRVTNMNVLEVYKSGKLILSEQDQTKDEP